MFHPGITVRQVKSGFSTPSIQKQVAVRSFNSTKVIELVILARHGVAANHGCSLNDGYRVRTDRIVNASPSALKNGRPEVGLIGNCRVAHERSINSLMLNDLD